MSKPLVAIVGRPNVGKSMLFNRLAGQRLSIVEDTPGVTRDRLYAPCEWCGRVFDIVDTGGIEPSTDSEILLFMREQAQIAIDSASVIILVTDIRTGVTDADKDVAKMLKRSGKPVILAVNKADSTGAEDPAVYEFYELGLGDPISVSAGFSAHGSGAFPVTYWITTNGSSQSNSFFITRFSLRCSDVSVLPDPPIRRFSSEKSSRIPKKTGTF